MYQAPDKKTWKGQTNHEEGKEGLRWHQLIQTLKLTRDVHLSGQQQNIAFLGFCCDEGVRRSKGRIGAQQGPDAIREAMANLPVHFNKGITSLFDAGNVICANQNLETSQQLLGQKVHHLLQHAFIPILLGGGHEISYGHYLGLHQHLKSHPEANIGFINIDAHLNFRPYSKDANSFTAFRQIADLRKNHNLEFHYLCLGVQQMSNSLASFKCATQHNIQLLQAADMRESKIEEVKHLITEWLKNKDWIYLSLDLDAISASNSPGVSSPNPYGLDPYVVKEILIHLYRSGKVLSMDIAELCPINDQQNRTALLAAGFVFDMVHTLSSHIKQK